jgi:hypothetical protein
MNPDFNNNDNSVDRYFWSMGSNNAEFRKFSDGNIYLGNTGLRIVISATTAMRLGYWQFHLLTVDATGAQFYYVDNVLVGSTAAAGWSNETALTIGNNAGTTVGSQAWIRGVILINQYVTQQAEMDRLAFDPRSWPRSQVVAGYDLEGPSGELDWGPNASNLTNSGSLPSTQEPFILNYGRDIWLAPSATSPPPPPPPPAGGGSAFKRLSGVPFIHKIPGVW